MATNQKFVKIQDIIEKANGVWNEEHDKKQKDVFKNNIILYPFNYFINISVIYLYFVGLYIFCALLFGDSIKNFQFIHLMTDLSKLVFNSPYYLFDIRLGVITSIASLLLSLYVSVGKYGDGLNGIANDARRVAYRRFARWVGTIIFFIYVVNFWHGLLAGYFRRDYYPAPKLLPFECPEWCNNLVQKDMDLARYGEMPLWVLLFFAWFTFASSLMLTYSEKDALVQNLSTMRRINGFMKDAGNSSAVQYIVASRVYDREKNSKVPDAEKYGCKLLDENRYYGFDFDSKIPRGVKRVRFWVVSIFWCTWIIPCVFIYCHYKSIYGQKAILISLIYAAFFVFVMCIEFYIIKRNRNFLFIEVYKFNIRQLKGSSKALEFFKFWASVYQWWIVFYVVMIIPNIVLYGAIRNSLQIKSFIIFFEWRDDWLIDLVCLFAILLFYSMPQIYMLMVMKPLFECEFKKYSEKSMEMTLKKMARKGMMKMENLNYLAVAYIYCLMRDVDRLYSEYKLEVGSASGNDD